MTSSIFLKGISIMILFCFSTLFIIDVNSYRSVNFTPVTEISYKIDSINKETFKLTIEEVQILAKIKTYQHINADRFERAKREVEEL